MLAPLDTLHCPHCHGLLPQAPVRSRNAPATKTHRRRKPATDAPKAIPDYSVEKATIKNTVWPSPIVIATFGDGEVVRAPAMSLKGKPVNVGRALRGAIDRYRTRVSDVNRVGWHQSVGSYVPKFTSVVVEGGEALDPVACSEFTAAAREPRRIRTPREQVYPEVYPEERHRRRLLCYRGYRKAGHPALVAWNIAKENYR